MEKESKDMFFVEVKNPNEVKRSILESMKSIVESLHGFEKFKAIRKDKIDKINKLKKTVKELNKLISNLKSILPESSLRVRESKVPARKAIPKSKSPKEKLQAAENPPTTELEKLESQLSQIEGKLSDLR